MSISVSSVAVVDLRGVQGFAKFHLARYIESCFDPRRNYRQLADRRLSVKSVVLLVVELSGVRESGKSE